MCCTNYFPFQCQDEKIHISRNSACLLAKLVCLMATKVKRRLQLVPIRINTSAHEGIAEHWVLITLVTGLVKKIHTTKIPALNLFTCCLLCFRASNEAVCSTTTYARKWGECYFLKYFSQHHVLLLTCE